MSTPAQPTPEILEKGIWVHDVSYRFGNEIVLKDVSLKIFPSQIIALLGQSGCGKTTLLRCLSGLLEPHSGRIRLDGETPNAARKRGDIGFAFQFPTLLPWRTVLNNVLLPLELLKKPQNGSAEFAMRLLELVDLHHDSAKYPPQLSGGMQQRVGLARSLINHPTFLFLDEPFGQLDGLTRDHLNEKVRLLWQDFRFTAVLVTHSIEEAVFLADQIVLLTNKPSHVRETVDINLSHRNPNIRNSKEFFDYIKLIRDKTRGTL